MKFLIHTSILALCCQALVFAASPLPEIPTTPIGVKKELLLEENFDATPDSRWHKVVPTFTISNGALVGEQTRDKTIPATATTKEKRMHAAVHGLELPTKDSIVETRIRFNGATMIDVEFTDRKYTGAHYGHICRAQVRLNRVTIIDERDGNMKNEIRAMNQDPSKKEERAKLLKGRSISFPVKLEQNRWYNLRVETVGDKMRVLIDDKPVAFLQSSGIGHETKSKIELGVAGGTGQFGSFDNFRVYNAAAK